VRLFVGIEIDNTVRARAAAIARSAQAVLDPVLAIRWVAAENLHLTLWFLGEVSEPRATAILTAVGPPFDVSAFDLRIGGFGAFPRSGTPRVLWLGVEAGQHSLAALHAELIPRLHPLGFEPERRPFSAHLTLGRVKGPRGVAHPRELRALWRDLPADAGVCWIQAVTVFRSRLSSKGAVYEPLVRVPLR
jgi:RNA 2',3'-cyclic 3'-phosphodiesterase